MLFDQLLAVRDSEPHSAPLNMAIDEALLRAASVPMVRFYFWKRPSVSFGYFLKYEDVAMAWPKRELVRRWTGGGVVSHGEDVTYTLIVPPDNRVYEMSAMESYRLIHECIANLLGDAGALAESASAKVSEACFENPARHDVLYEGRKIAGAAQRRTKFGLLHQGSIQCQDLSVDWFLRERLPGALSMNPAFRGLTAVELKTAEQLVQSRYGTDAWKRRF